jgi:L-amino acid N-acyltransferase YncA
VAREDDAPGILEIYAPIVRDTAISFELEVPNELEMRARIQKTLAWAPWLVCEQDGRIAGYAYATRFRERAAYQWTVEVTVYVHALHRRRGVARSLYTRLFDELRAQGFVTAIAGIALPNAESVALHESCGFRPIGVFHCVGYKLGRWHDTGWWELALCAAPTQPRMPRPASGAN